MKFPIVIVIAALLGAGPILFWHYGKKPYKHKGLAVDDLEKYFATLLNRGFNGGFLVIEVPKRPLFIQFSKYIGKQGSIGLQFDFPRVGWSENYYELVKNEASKSKFQFSLQRGSDHTEFITINLNQDIAQAVVLSKLVLQSVFKLDPATKLNLFFGNVSPKDEKIVS
jgi:hypothetical protein